VLLARLRPGTTAEAFQDVVGRFLELATTIEGIVGVEYGKNNSPEDLNRGLTHVIVLTFASVQARDAYLPHPEHQQLADWVGQMGILEDMLVVDYVPISNWFGSPPTA
jgi:Stress responsive A/B Barrel Domain